MLRIEVPIEEAELAADALWSAGASAVGEEARGAVVVLTADLDRCPQQLRDWAHEVVDPDPAWADGWRPFARAAVVGPFRVRAPWVEADVPRGAIELVIDAGRAFGTGTHPSTALALRALADHVRPGAAVLDAGCGSGTLAVAAARLGATRVLAVDTDAAAVAATVANAARNDVVGRLTAELAAVERVTGTFDVVVANLGSPLVHDLAPALLTRCRAGGGVLILSGMLGDHRHRIDLPLVEHHEAEGWTCAVVRRDA